MKKLFMGLEIVILSAFGLSGALAATVEVLVIAGGGGGAKPSSPTFADFGIEAQLS